jgi:carboxyl-terminal processing protease
VITPFEGFPGAKAGIIPGDRIIRVDGNDVSGDTYEEAVAMLKGPPGTSVNVTLYREGECTFEIAIIREQIDIPTVSHRMLDDGVGYIRITNFDRVTYNQFVTAYEDLKSQNMQGLIIDLRNNPGGLLNIVTDMTNLLVPEGYIVYTEDRNGIREYIFSDAERHIEIPLALIVNGNSASASEVMAGAVKDMGVGSLVGTQTFGKGLVQNLFDLSDGTALKITIAKYYTPSGVCIHGEGITPCYIVDMPNELTTRLSALSLEEDPQLQKAIDVILRKIGE